MTCLILTICFLDDIDKYFKEVYKILKHSGSFIIGFIDIKSYIGKIYEKIKDKNVFYKIANFKLKKK